MRRIPASGKGYVSDFQKVLARPSAEVVRFTRAKNGIVYSGAVIGEVP
jgi:hypothetical protein